MPRRATVSNKPEKTRAEKVRLQLAVEIVSGRYRAGARLDEVLESDRMGVSRTPLREAVRQLATLGLVENRPHRGVFVSDGISDALFETLAELESSCARLAAERMKPEKRVEFAKLVEEGGDWLAALHRSTGNSVMASLIATLWQPVLEDIVLPDEQRRLLANRLAQALKDRDPHKAQATMRDYVTTNAAIFRERANSKPR